MVNKVALRSTRRILQGTLCRSSTRGRLQGAPLLLQHNHCTATTAEQPLHRYYCSTTIAPLLLQHNHCTATTAAQPLHRYYCRTTIAPLLLQNNHCTATT
eukprot:Lankesteria_metandrocarpae@DN4657_c0_g1_i2.p1